MKQYSRVSYEVRCQIHAFLQVNMPIPEIAKRLGFHKSTIYREIKRNSRYEYTPKIAEKLSRDRYKRCRRRYAITEMFAPYIKYGFKNDWSPEQISGRLRKDFKKGPSHSTIYRYAKEFGYQKKLRRHKKVGAGRYLQRKRALRTGLNIKERPAIANNRGRIGDWERDTMHTKNGIQLLVCTDRKSRYTKIAKVETRTRDKVDLLTKKIIEDTGKKIFTLTNDNGGDFRGKKGIDERVYFCDPHKPQQRGTVENTIGLLRHYIKRKTDIKHMDCFLELEKKLNLRPRKVLNYKTPYEVYYGEKLHWQL